ncbi:MAG TPA: hypothetical protein VFV63_20775, partial [Ilumatobacteraceae bacterium]|nr:hypothetical protein [Ilumatobacteraceae bacterium]
MRTRPLLPLALSILVFTAAACGDDDSEASAITPTVTEASVPATDMTSVDTTVPGTGAADAPMEAAV